MKMAGPALVAHKPLGGPIPEDEFARREHVAPIRSVGTSRRQALRARWAAWRCSSECLREMVDVVIADVGGETSVNQTGSAGKLVLQVPAFILPPSLGWHQVPSKMCCHIEDPDEQTSRKANVMANTARST